MQFINLPFTLIMTKRAAFFITISGLCIFSGITDVYALEADACHAEVEKARSARIGEDPQAFSAYLTRLRNSVIKGDENMNKLMLSATLKNLESHRKTAKEKGIDLDVPGKLDESLGYLPSSIAGAQLHACLLRNQIGKSATSTLSHEEIDTQGSSDSLEALGVGFCSQMTPMIKMLTDTIPFIKAVDQKSLSKEICTCTIDHLSGDKQFSNTYERFITEKGKTSAASGFFPYVHARLVSSYLLCSGKAIDERVRVFKQDTSMY
jgi:hypothetical protein